MARTKNKLTAAMVRTSKPGRLYADGGGLFLQVTSGTDGKPKKSWVVRVTLPGRRVREMGLGSAAHIELSEARTKADEARALAREGIDPIADRTADRRRKAEEAARRITFKEAAETYIDTHDAGWRNEKHRKQWRRTLEMYAYPVFGDVAVETIDVEMVLKVLDPLWRTKTETASRLRGRIETVLDWAAVRRGRPNDSNPARWRGHLQRALPLRSKVQKVKHHAALPYSELPAFMKRLRRNTSATARALEFTILTAARTGEVLNAKWSEVDRMSGVWIIPADRMKAGREHRVPLGVRATQIVADLDDLMPSSEWVFPGAKAERPLSSMAMLELLRGMKVNATTHGFRSTFRDWAAEETIHAREVAEAALAHIVGDKSEQAYQRGDFFEKRRLLMDEWDRYASGVRSQNKATKRPQHTKLRSGVKSAKTGKKQRS